MKILLLIAITILAVGCGGKDESTSKTKPELNGVPEEKIELREGIWYLKGLDTPFTGKVFSLHENGQKKYEGNFKDGKKDGISLGWQENGQKEFEEYYKDGKLEGPSNAWYENGQKHTEANFKDGKPDGQSVMWHKNGQKHTEGNFKDGILISEKFWNSRGESVDSEEEATAE